MVEVEVINGVLDDVLVEMEIVVVSSKLEAAEVVGVLEEAEVRSVVI